MFIFFQDNSATGEPQLVVKLEVNGILFEGVLFSNPNTSPSASTTSLTPSTTSTEPMSSPQKTPTVVPPTNTNMTLPSPNRNSNALNDDHNKLAPQPIVSS